MPNAGYRVLDVQVDGVSKGAKTSYAFTNVTADHTISVTFTPNVFTLAATAYARGSISPTGATVVNRGGSQAYTIIPDPGYAVMWVIVDSLNLGPVTSYTFTNVTIGHTISVYFKAAP